MGLDNVVGNSFRWAGRRFITPEKYQQLAGRFSAGARQYAENLPTRVVLIDGARLAGLMIWYGVGVQVKRTVSIVEIDEDFFE